MVAFVVRRLLWSVLLLLIISLITFVVFVVMPSADPALLRAGRNPTPELVASIRETLGLDRPWYVQYGIYVKDLVLHFDFGYSYQNNVPVRDTLFDRIPATVSLAVGGAVLWLLAGVVIGIVSAIKRGTVLDRLTMGGALIAISAPAYWLGLVVIYLFSDDLGKLVPLFPGAGRYTPLTTDPVAWASALVLPWIVLATSFSAVYARFLRSNLLDVMGEDYIRTAKAKGLPERRVVLRHGVRSAVTPVVTMFGLDLGILLGGAILIEAVFNIPGVGRLAFDAIQKSDLPMVQGTVLIGALAIVVMNLAVDVLYAILDPRVRYRSLRAIGSASMEPITIVIADDHALVRSGLRQLLEAEGDMTVVGEAGNADAALELARASGPRVLLLDLSMPGTPSLEAIPGFVALSPAPAVVVLTAHDEDAFAREALAAGASAYVLKDAAETNVVEAIRAAVAGRPYLDPAMGARFATASRPPAPAPAVPAGELAIGSTFAGHRVEGIAGRGGMGVVYKAIDLTLDRRVALKLIAPGLAADPVFRARFELECRLAASIDHPHAVEPFRAGEERGLLYVTMRYVEGTDLRELLRAAGRLEPRRAATIVDEVAGALDEAHRRGLVHRDVKPANVLIASHEGVERAYLTDFGVCRQRAVGSDLTGTGLAIGSADYMAPEQAQGADVDARADIYSLGCVLFQTLTGTVPYDRDSDLEKLWAHAHEAPPALRDTRPDLPAALGDVLARSMAKDPSERQTTAGMLGRQALAAVGG